MAYEFPRDYLYGCEWYNMLCGASAQMLIGRCIIANDWVLRRLTA